MESMIPLRDRAGAGHEVTPVALAGGRWEFVLDVDRPDAVRLSVIVETEEPGANGWSPVASFNVGKAGRYTVIRAVAASGRARVRWSCSNVVRFGVSCRRVETGE